jgi:hypothetical protein
MDDAAPTLADAGGWQIVALRGSSAPIEVLALCSDAAEARARAKAEGGVAVFRGPVPLLNAAPAAQEEWW